MNQMTVGVDIGQSRDPTAIVATHTYRTEPEVPASLEPGGPLPDHMKPPEEQFRPETHHQIALIRKVPLGTPYPNVVEHVCLAADWAKQYGNVTVVMDATGVGRPVVDLFRQATSHPLRAVTFTGGGSAKRTDAYSWRVPKRELVASLQVVMDTDRLRAVPDLDLATDLRAELQSFDFTFTDAGNDTYEARAGKHDDLVAALALAVWWAEKQSSGQGRGFLEAWRRLAQKSA